jgi:hypothetical protein
MKFIASLLGLSTALELALFSSVNKQFLRMLDNCEGVKHATFQFPTPIK